MGSAQVEESVDSSGAGVPADREDDPEAGVTAADRDPEGPWDDPADADRAYPDDIDGAEGVEGVEGAVPAPYPADEAADTSVVERDAPEAPYSSLRADFGAHFEAHYPRLVGQLFAITLDSGAAHDLVQDAYSRAWKQWAQVRRGDAEGWVRRVAVRASRNPVRRWASRLGLRTTRLPQQDTVEPRTAAVLGALADLPLDERRTAVLVYMAGLGVTEVAALERVSSGTVQARLNRVGTRVEHAVAGLEDLGEPERDEEER